MAFIPGAATAFNLNSGAWLPLTATSVPNRRLFIQPSQRMRISLDAGTNYGIVGAQDAGRAHDLGVTNPNALTIKSDTGSAGTCYWWTLDAGES